MTDFLQPRKLYLGNNKLNLVVSPKYARAALEIYGELDKKEYFNVAVLDTEKASQNQPQVQKGALSEEVTVRESYLRPYMDLLLGRVIKCDTIDELPVEASRLERLGEPFAASETRQASISFKSFLND